MKNYQTGLVSFLLLMSFQALAEESVQVLETVPPPAVDKKEPTHKIEKEAQSGLEQTEIGLIKTEKNLKNGGCKMVKGKLVCPKKEIKKKTIEEDPNVLDLKKSKK